MIFLDIGRGVGLHHLEVVHGVRHHPERIAQLVSNAARQLAEHGELLASYQLLLGVLQGRECVLQFLRPLAYAQIEAAVSGLDFVRHRVERMGEPAHLIATGRVDALRELARGYRFDRVGEGDQGRGNAPADGPGQERTQRHEHQTHPRHVPPERVSRRERGRPRYLDPDRPRQPRNRRFGAEPRLAVSPDERYDLVGLVRHRRRRNFLGEVRPDPGCPRADPQRNPTPEEKTHRFGAIGVRGTPADDEVPDGGRWGPSCRSVRCAVRYPHHELGE